MTKRYVAWASVTETIKYYFDAASQEEADQLVDQVNSGDIDLSELHYGNYSLKGVEVTSDYAEEA